MAGRPINRDLHASAATAVRPGARTGSGAPSAQPVAPAVPRTLEDVDWLADQLGIKRSRAYELVAAGLVPCLRLGKRIYIPTRGLTALAERAIALGLSTDIQVSNE